MPVRAFKYEGLDFRGATTQEDRSDLITLCADVYRAEFGGDPVGDPIFDIESVWFGAWQQGRAVGTVRCVLDSPRGLPMESGSATHCDVWRARGTICEMGRFAVQRDLAVAPFALMGLLRLSLWYTVENDVSFLLACAPLRIWPLYQRMQMVAFGEPFRHPTGESFVSGVLDFYHALVRALRDVEQGTHSSFVHEILAQRSGEEDEMMRAYMARRSSGIRKT